jgi:hypothetical protein
VVKAPGTKRNPPPLLIELNPVDENSMPTKRRGLYIGTRKDLEEYRKLINDRNLDALGSALEEVNGRREEGGEEPEGLGGMSAPTVLVGRKPVSSYVLACLHTLQQNGSVEVRATGRA